MKTWKIKSAPSPLPPVVLEHRQDLCSCVTLTRILGLFFYCSLTNSGSLNLIIPTLTVPVEEERSRWPWRLISTPFCCLAKKWLSRSELARWKKTRLVPDNELWGSLGIKATSLPGSSIVTESPKYFLHCVPKNTQSIMSFGCFHWNSISDLTASLREPCHCDTSGLACSHPTPQITSFPNTLHHRSVYVSMSHVYDVNCKN